MSDAATELAPIDAANLLAGQAVAYATAYLDGRQNAEQLAAHAARVHVKLVIALHTDTAPDPAVKAILNPVRLLAVAMTHAARATDQARQDRWRDVMGSLIELTRIESRALRGSKAATEEGR
jgi:hypothetical protein